VPGHTLQIDLRLREESVDIRLPIAAITAAVNPQAG